MAEPNEWIPVRDFSLIFGLDRTTIRAKVAKGELEQYRASNRNIFIRDPHWLRAPARASDNFGKENVHCLRGIEVAAMMKVTPRAVRYWAQFAKVTEFRVGPGRGVRRYSIADVRNMIARRENKKGEKRKRGPAVRAAILAWALKQLALPAE